MVRKKKIQDNKKKNNLKQKKMVEVTEIEKQIITQRTYAMRFRIFFPLKIYLFAKTRVTQ